MRNLLTILLLTILGCNRTTSSSTSNKGDSLIFGQKRVIDSLDVHVINFDSSYYYLFPKSFTTVYLSDKEIVECENLLRLYIVDYNAEATKKFEEVKRKYPNVKFSISDFTIDLSKYGRQYMSVVSDLGERVVYVNCFCDPTEFSYRDKELVQVEDGGNCFFNFRVNLKKNRIFDFMENGVA
jgi:hypothetical protein